MAAGVRSFKFDKHGATVKGVILSADLQQQRDINTKAPLVWDDGRPKMQARVVLQTDTRENDDDDGQRAIYVKGAMQKAVKDAINQAGATRLEPGGTLAVQYEKDGEKTGNLTAPKLYKAKYEPPVAGSAGVSADDLF